MSANTSALRRRPLLSALAAQALGLLLAVVFAWILPEWRNYPWMLPALQGAGAAIASHHLGAPRWWQAIHLLFAPALLWGIQQSFPPWLWLVAFALTFLVFGRTDRNQVPLFLTNRTAGNDIARLIPERPSFVADLGCGEGGLLGQLATLRPDCEFVGIEHAWIPGAIARLRTRHLGNVHIRRGDIWAQPLAPYDVVYAFLSPAPMADLWRKACAEMRPDTLLISNSFPIPDVAAETLIAVDDRRVSQLYVYRIPAALDPS